MPTVHYKYIPMGDAVRSLGLGLLLGWVVEPSVLVLGRKVLYIRRVCLGALGD